MIDLDAVLREIDRSGEPPSFKEAHRVLAILFKELEESPELMKCLLHHDSVAQMYSTICQRSRRLTAKDTLKKKMAKFYDNLSDDEKEMVAAMNAINGKDKSQVFDF